MGAASGIFQQKRAAEKPGVHYPSDPGGEPGGDGEQLGLLGVRPVVRVRLCDAEHAAERFAAEHGDGYGAFHSSRLCGGARLAGCVGLEVAERDGLATLSGDAGDAFADGHGLHDLHDRRWNVHMCDEGERAVFHQMHGPGVACEVRDRGAQDFGGVSGGEGGFEFGGQIHAGMLARAVVACHGWGGAGKSGSFMPADRLKQILDVKAREVARLLPKAELLRTAALERDDFRGFAARLDLGPDRLALIAEVKKASPSAGVIAADFDPIAIAGLYEAAGASCVSVLTDEQFFQGHLSYLTRIRKEIALPCLRKDFIIHEVQLYEAAVAGADAVLLIVAALEQAQLHHLFRIAEMLQLEVLVEVHTEDELFRALDLDVRLLGINNRNLTTFEVDLETTERLSEEVPDGIVLVSESGLKTNADARRVFDCGCNAILVGEALMRTGDVGARVAELLAVQ